MIRSFADMDRLASQKGPKRLVVLAPEDEEFMLAVRESAAKGYTRPVLIGDRHHDVEGGAAQGVPVIFVRWGFSWPHESEGAAAVVENADELRALLLIDDSAERN